MLKCTLKIYFWISLNSQIGNLNAVSAPTTLPNLTYLGNIQALGKQSLDERWPHGPGFIMAPGAILLTPWSFWVGV